MEACWIKIVAASDEQIERFVIAINNDTDEDRRRRYSRLVCLVDRHSPSAHTLSMLRGTFASVRQVKAQHCQSAN
jgi:hypothetical protein